MAPAVQYICVARTVQSEGTGSSAHFVSIVYSSCNLKHFYFSFY